MTTKAYLGPLDTFLSLADHNRQMTDHFLSKINRHLTLLLEDPGAHVTYVPGDGWVIVFTDHECDCNHAAIAKRSLDALLTMTKEEAILELRRLSI